ncbi:acyl-CoA dehydrogenase family protein [Pseudomonas ogarae]|uniref:acyl-CoA dehydrogenase family protein n=1 Tax=Pseudomonas ogarae (strain DSM 112162 / CECT 30235 / F113) TaxID=1114970 RepID=UPI00158FFE61|nr:acyl-CoA dehydrogenase family protein [Pseudomonas ogarae]
MANSESRKLADISDELLLSLRSEFAATAAEHDEQATFPHANFKRLAELDLLALTVPKDYGGLGGGLKDAARVIGAVAAGDASTGLLLAMNYLAHHVLAQTPPIHYAAIARSAVEGRGIMNGLQAEPELGAAIRGGLPVTVALPQADGNWSVNGRKAYATGSPIVNWWLAMARSGTDDAPLLGTVLIPGDAPGFTITPNWNHTGLRATASHELQLKDIVVPVENVLGFYPPGAPELKARQERVQVWNGVLLAALYDGVARAGRDWLIAFLHERKPSSLGAALASVPRLQGVVGEIDTLLLINRTLIEDTAQRADTAVVLDPVRAQQIKHIVTENALRALDLGVSISGNHGLNRANPLERHYRDALCGRVHAPQADVVLLNVGKAALGV